MGLLQYKGLMDGITPVQGTGGWDFLIQGTDGWDFSIQGTD